MNQSSVFFKNHLFNKELNNNLELLIQCSNNVLAYAIKTIESNKIIALYFHQNKLRAIDVLRSELKNRMELQQHFKQVHICYATGNEILVPEWIANKPQNWINNFLTPSNDKNLIPTETINGMVPLVEIPNELERLLQEFGFNKVNYYHPVSVFLNKKDGLYIDFNANSAYFVYLKNNLLQFQKAFEITNADELNYFILLLKDQLNIENETPICLSGLIDKEDNYYARIIKYFKEVNFNIQEISSFKETINQNLPEHYFTSLISLNSCASLAEN